MAKVKAKVSFAGIITMGAGEVRDIPDEMIGDLIRIGYVEKIETESVKKTPAKASKKKGDE
ncbi:MAG TPA: hypothetical protein O0X62_03815 [Methanocorpusculum sp.]|nr:hypothetical protein [Methanocorpusculum sp.]